MNKQKVLSNESAPPALDEGWWSSLLADEVTWGQDNPAAHPEKPRPPAGEDGGIVWQQVLRMYEDDEIVEAVVNGFNQGGLLVEADVLHGFVPVSHLVDLDMGCDGATVKISAEELKALLTDYVGGKIRLKVIECDPARGRIVLSERAALAAPGQRNQLLDRLACGDRVSGTVTNITEFGVFVDLGGLEGLIHISELSWGRVRHPADVLQLGEEVAVYVISADRERCRVALSLKRLHANPWESAETRYQIGQLVDARVTSVVSFGAFARLEEGLDGLIHISEMPQELVDPLGGHNLHEGQFIQARIVHIDPRKQRLGLSLKTELG